MELQKTKHEIKLGQWRERIAECRSSGLQVVEWCRSQGISPSTYYRWQRLVWNKGVEQMQALPLPVQTKPTVLEGWARIEPAPAEPSVALEINDCRVEVTAATDRELLTQVCRMLKEL